MINYNIFKIIVDKVVVNKWKNKIKMMNQEYKKIYYYDYAIFGNTCKCYIGMDKQIMLYDRRTIFIGELKQCSECGYLIEYEGQQNVSSKYHYTSGMNDPKAYKKIEKK